MTPLLRKRLEQALTAHRAGKLEQACLEYERLLREFGPDAQVLHFLGAALVSRNQLQAGVARLEEAIRLSPGLVAAHVALGHARRAQGDVAGAEASYREALRHDAKSLEALCHLARLRQDESAFDEALDLYGQALLLKPDFPEVWFNVGTIHQVAGRTDAAVGAYVHAIQHRPGYAAAWSHLSACYLAAGKSQEALEAAESAVRENAAYAEGWNNLGNVRLGRDELSEAEQCFRRAVSLKNGYAEAWSNLGNVLAAAGKKADARQAYEQAIAFAPDLPDARYNLALLDLVEGQFERGWEGYELRWRSEMKQWQRRWEAPPWDGRADLNGKTILVHAEQGLGDTLQFCRYYLDLLNSGARVLAEVQPPLRSLIQRSFPSVDVVTRGEECPRIDYRIPLLSLPRVFWQTAGHGAKRVPYLKVDLEARAYSQERRAGRRVGVVWSGNPRHKNDRNRSLTLEQIKGVFRDRALEVISLQKEPREGSDSVHAAGWEDISARLVDFDATAAVVAGLDLVITVDTALAHLAGGLGVPTWVLLPFAPDWRWLLDRKDSPWYPSVRLFRQPRPGDWQSVLDQVRQALEK